MPTTKRRALILISSGRQLPLVEPAEVKSISTGFFLVEMAQVLKEFENDYEFTFATPDGNAPQLDINGMALSVQSIEKTGFKTLPMRMQQRRRSFDVSTFRVRHPELVARREQEVRLLERHIGRIPVSELLPNSEPELAEYRSTRLNSSHPSISYAVFCLKKNKHCGGATSRTNKQQDKY